MKAYNRLKYILLLLSVICLFLFNTSCGLDVFYVISAPYEIVHRPSYDSTDFSDRYFSFWTNEPVSTTGFSFQGTDVYYKIYNNVDNMTSEVNTLQSLSNSETTSSTSANKLIDPSTGGGYGYSKLKVQEYYNEPLIPYTGSNQKVYIRLTDYQNLEEYSARILIGGSDGSNLYGSASKTIPVRDNRYSFNFGRSGTNDKVPLSIDSDVKYNSETSDTKWYVAMFAVSVGYDTSYVSVYSNILYLGSVTIDQAESDN